MEIEPNEADNMTTSEAYEETMNDARELIQRQSNQEKVSELLGVDRPDMIVHPARTLFRDGTWYGSIRGMEDAVVAPAKKKEPRTWRDERVVPVLDRSPRKNREKGIRSSIDDGNHHSRCAVEISKSTSDDDSENHPDRGFWYQRRRKLHCHGRLLKGLSECFVLGNGNTFVFVKNCDIRGNDNVVVHCKGGQLRGDNYVVHYAESTIFHTTSYVLYTGKWNHDPDGNDIFPDDVRSSSSDTEMVMQ